MLNYEVNKKLIGKEEYEEVLSVNNMKVWIKIYLFYFLYFNKILFKVLNKCKRWILQVFLLFFF